MKRDLIHFSGWLVALWMCLLGAGCQETPEPEGLAELKASLAGFRRESMENAAEVRDTLQDHTDSLRAIRDAVDIPDAVPGDAGRLDRPQEVEQLSPPAASDYYLVMWTSKSCGPCVRWELQEQPYLEAQGIEVVKIDVAAHRDKAKQYNVTTTPSFEWCVRSTKKVAGTRFVGYRTAMELLRGKPKQQSKPANQQASTPKRATPVVQTQWGTINLQTYANPGCNCAMCQGIRRMQRQNGYPVQEYRGQTRTRRRTWFKASVQPAQEPVSEPELQQALELLNLKESDVFADIGCGDGRVLIEAHLLSGCRCVGIEIDSAQAERAKVNVRNAGLSDHIDIIEGDARQFRPAGHGVTAAVAYLYPDLLAELRPMLETIPRLATPWHPVDGMQGEQHGNVWVYQGGCTVTPYFQNERCTIYHGDCAEVLPQLGRFDLLLTDPPYGIGATRMTMGSGQSSKRAKDRFSSSHWDDAVPDLSGMLAAANQLCVWGGNYFADQLPVTRDWLVWHKQNDGRSFSECELAWTNFGCSARHKQWRWGSATEVKQHATQKPLALMQWCIGLANAPETIVDPFMGSGTTLHAAQLEGRHCVGIEREESYCEIAADRLAQKVLF